MSKKECKPSGPSLGERLLGIMRRRFPRRVRRLRDGKYAVRYRDASRSRVYTIMTLDLRGEGYPVVHVDELEPSDRYVRSESGFNRAVDKAEEVMCTYHSVGKRLVATPCDDRVSIGC